MEAMIYHFKLIMDGIQVPEGSSTACRGGQRRARLLRHQRRTGKPYRIHCRPPCFPIFSTFPSLINGGSLSDAIVSITIDTS